MSSFDLKGRVRPHSATRGAPLVALFALAVAAACSSSGTQTPSSSTGSASGPTSAPPTAAPSAPAGYVTIARGAHPLAKPQFDTGRLDPTRVLHNLSLVFKLSPEQKADRDALLDEIQRPGSPSYHKWLTPEDYAARFGAQADDISRASSWLASQGMTVHEPSRLGARVTFTGTVAQIEAAFQTEMHTYSVRDESHYAMAFPPSLPADIGEHVLAVYNAHDFYAKHSKPQVRVVNPQATCPAGALNCTTGTDGIAPPDWSVIYDVGPLYNPGIAGTLITGASVTIAVVGVTEISQTDLTAFRTRYGFASNPITMTLVPNTGAAQAANGAGIEAVLDTEWSGAIAPKATINYVYTGASDVNVDDATYYAIEQNYGAVLSESWGGCEEGATTADADVLEVYGSAASLEGTSYLASSGDDGAAACQGEGGLWVNMPASYPGVTGVGGTGFGITPSQLTFTGGTVSARGTESVWNEFHNAYTANGVAAGGGGISSVFARPSYQSAITTCSPVGTLPSGVTAANQRQVPDVAFTAAEGASQYGIFIECTYNAASGDCNASGTDPVVIEIGGTSASTPSFAGVIALANQATGGRLGNINPLLYAFDHSQPTFFHDITTGNNEVECRTADTGCPGNNVLYGYVAGTGYDCASGLGSVDATKLVTAWATPATVAPTETTLVAAPTTTTEGGSVTLNATVAVEGTNANALGGTVTFTFESFLANGIDLDQSWTLGQVAIAGGTTTGGTASLTTAIPPGMVKPNQIVDVSAMYGGDANHLPSYSAKEPITFTGVALCIDPPTDSVAKGGKIAYTALGGVTPVRWYIDWDSTCNAAGANCSTLNETTGAFVAGTGANGYVIVEAFDADGADTYAEVTVGGGGGIVPWNAGPSNYSEILVSATPATTCPVGDNCSTVPNGCGGTVSCGTCTAPQTCGGGTPSNPNQCGCTPTTTTCPAGDNCGTVSNGCGGTVSCGPACTAPDTCGGGGTANVCGCTPTTTCPAGDNCGTVSNGCGGTVSCGTCTAPDTCAGGGTANVCGCTPTTTCPAGDNCGTVSNGCGGTVSCGTCTAPQTCGGAGTANQCGCTPITTCPAGDNCGTVPNGCGGTVSCGPACTAPQTCGGSGTANQCGCTPITTCPAGDNCGTISNGCGGTVSCGPACTAPQTCGGSGTANQCGCTPITTCPAGDNCGTVPNGCGGTVSCGTCTAPQTCGGSGTANECGCTPITTCPAGDNCGTVPNGCGGTVNCGTCTAPQTCGGSGNANECGCTPITTCPAGDNCGTVPNGCGGTVNCGTCTAPETCGGNVCGCTPITTCPAGDNCGTIPNGCGGTVNCGTCTAPQTCGGSGSTNECGCTPITTCPAGENCGTISNGCGGTVNCGTCTAPQTCGGSGSANECGCTPVTTCPAGDNCGTVPNGCGGSVNCGTCTAPQTCGGSGKANECGCTPITTCPAGDNCGTVANGCGGTVNCGTCTAPETCGGNVCGSAPITTCPAGDTCGTVSNGCGGT
ncbi:MAG: protease pro-enzyme activation domain-containing protein, partial [Polyangiaceae bacterium]